MNDLRVTRDGESITKTIKRIENNRKCGVKYDSRGDVVRTARDVLDYMYLAGFLDRDIKGRFTQRQGTSNAFNILKRSKCFFNEYNEYATDNAKASSLKYDWLLYVESQYKDFIKRIDNLEYGKASADSESEVNSAKAPLGEQPLPDSDDTAEIGRRGEQLALQHEVLRLKKDGRSDLVHLVKQMPTHLAVGFDIKSLESDTEEDRFIEVKTCLTRQRVKFNNFHLTPNEWRVAESHGEKYCVYRIAIDDEGIQLFVIRNPIQQFRDRTIRLSFRHSVQLNFTDKAGEFQELLCAPTK